MGIGKVIDLIHCGECNRVIGFIWDVSGNSTYAVDEIWCPECVLPLLKERDELAAEKERLIT